MRKLPVKNDEDVVSSSQLNTKLSLYLGSLKDPYLNKRTCNTQVGNSFIKKILTTSYALSLSLTMAVFSLNQAQAASLNDLFADSGESSSQKKFLKVDQAFSVKPTQNGDKLKISLHITPKYYIYKDKLSIKTPQGVTASSIKFSHPSQAINDPVFGKVNVFKQQQVTATATLTNTTSSPIKQDITISWQGCAEDGLCYPPQSEVVSIQLPAKVAAQTESKSNTAKHTSSAPTTTLESQKATTGQAPETVSSSPQTDSENIAKQVSQDDDNTLNEGVAFNEELAGNNADGSNSDIEGVEGNNELLTTEIAASQDDQSSRVLDIDTQGLVDEDPFGLAEHPWLALLLLYLAGLGLAFTACVLPMLPIVSNIIARQHAPTAKKGLILSGSYALGVSVAYGILGAVIALFGEQLGIIGWLQNPVILLTFAAVFVLLALYMLDVIRIPVPNAIKQKANKLSQAGDKYLGSTFGSFIAGLLSALVVSPCVSPPLFGALLAVSTIGNPLLGFAALFVLGFGLSSPLMLLGVSQSNFMPKAGEWMNWVKQGFALMLFGVALLLVERVLMSPLMLMLWAFWFMVVAVWAWMWSGRGQLLTKPLALVLGVWAVISLIGAAIGSKDSWQPLNVLQQTQTLPVSTLDSGQAVTVMNNTQVNATDIQIKNLDDLLPIVEKNPKVLVDVTAEWCIECRIMDKTLFTNRPAKMGEWQFVHLDVTESNEESARILSELRLFGPPALLYFVDGKLAKQQVGTVERDEFEHTLAQL